MIILALGVAAAWTICFKLPPGWDFRNNLYLPVNLILQNQSPYNIHVLVEHSNAVWLPMALGVFLPLGYLELQQATNFWWLVNISALVVLTYITIEKKPPPLPKLAFTVLMVFLFPSTVSHLYLGQISILICLIFVMIIWFWERIPIWGIGLLLAFTLTKPQLTLVFLPVYCYTVQREQGWRALWRLGLWTFAGVVILCLPMILIYPDWYKDFISNQLINHTWEHPSIHVLLFLPLGLTGQMLSWVYIGIGIGAAFYGIKRLGNKEGLLWSLALTPVISPYIWSWDFVFLYPLMIYSIFKQRSLAKTTLLISSYFLVMAGFVTLKFIGQIEEYVNWWVPWIILGITLLSSSGTEQFENLS
jgi:hypothetical protein